MRRRCGLLRCHGACRSDRGTVTAEFAVMLPAVIVVAMLILVLTRLAAVQIGCQDAARDAARVAQTLSTAHGVRGQDARIVSAARQHAGTYASVSISEDAQAVRIDVTCPAGPGPLHIFPASLYGHAYAVKAGDSYE